MICFERGCEAPQQYDVKTLRHRRNTSMKLGSDAPMIKVSSTGRAKVVRQTKLPPKVFKPRGTTGGAGGTGKGSILDVGTPELARNAEKIKNEHEVGLRLQSNPMYDQEGKLKD